RNMIESAQASNIIAIVSLKDVKTGHTLANENNPATLEPMVFPEPVISMSIKAKNKTNSEKMSTALSKLVSEDPSFHVEIDQESSETILKSMSELHLNIKVNILKRTYSVEATVSEPRVTYRETITKAVSNSYTHKKQTGGSDQYAK